MTQDYLADLTPPQREAATHFEGPLLILAGAGSGKTRVITRRVAHLIHEGVRPYNILAITFTNKAAGEMRQRVDALLPESRVWVSTFHSLGARLLRQYADRIGLDRNFTIYDQDDRVKLVKSALEAAGIDNVRFTPERIQAAISKAKNQLLLPGPYEARASDFFTKTAAAVYPVYEKKLRDANAVDFDDLLLLPALALKNDPELRAELDARFRFVLVDEYQDTNSAQYAIARHLSIDQPNLCVVGDPDQSIYKWRGSDIRNILDFEKDFPNARVIALEQNFRSTQVILRAASHLIAHNRHRKPKDLRTHNPPGQPVTVLTFGSSQDEADGIARRIQEAVTPPSPPLRKGGQAGSPPLAKGGPADSPPLAKGGPGGVRRNFRDFALFLRINALSRSLESAFLKHRVPYQIVRGLAFYDRKENKDVLAYVRLLVNPRDDLSFLRAVNEPARGIGKVSVEHLRGHAEPRELSLLSAAAAVDQVPAIKGKAAAGLREFAELMSTLRTFIDAPPDEVIRQVLDQSGYRQMLQKSKDPEDEERLANIEEMITAARQFAEEDSSRTIADFLENVTLASDVDGWDERQDCVSIMTLHSAKGLEFPVVYMLAVEQGLLPHERSRHDPEELEEERRLAFVGMTRAKEELYLSHAVLREFRGQTVYTVPSPFLDELPDDAIEHRDLSNTTQGRDRSFDEWRGGHADADQGWDDAGVTARANGGRKPPAKASSREAPLVDDGARRYVEGMLVRHETYGHGRVTEVSGYGALRKVKIRFKTEGERTFLVEKAKLAIISC